MILMYFGATVVIIELAENRGDMPTYNSGCVCLLIALNPVPGEQSTISVLIRIKMDSMGIYSGHLSYRNVVAQVHLFVRKESSYEILFTSHLIY